jgi:hypothetical protein
MRKDYKVIDKPWEYRITKFIYECRSDDILEHYIEIRLEKGNEVKLLRFSGPRNLKIEEGFPHPTGGMEIIDVSTNGLEAINIHVNDMEASNGAITFWAKDVIEIK